MFSSNFQAVLATCTTDYEKLTVDEIADFYEQFETNEARKKANNEYSQRSNNTSHSSRYKKRKVNHANNSQQSNKRVKCNNDIGQNHKNGKKLCYTYAKAGRKPAVVISYNKDKCKFNKRYNNRKEYESCKNFNSKTAMTALTNFTNQLNSLDVKVSEKGKKRKKGSDS